MMAVGIDRRAFEEDITAFSFRLRLVGPVVADFAMVFQMFTHLE
jgi:hypothetical protein